MARNYGKKTQRYLAGGIVPKEVDDERKVLPKVTPIPYEDIQMGSEGFVEDVEDDEED